MSLIVALALVACTPPWQSGTGEAPPAAAEAAPSGAGTPQPLAETRPPLQRITPIDEAPRHVARAQEYPGTGLMAVAPSASRGPRGDLGGTGDVSFNFVNADIREVARELLGDQLHLSYVVDSKVQATITAATGRPLARAAVLPTLESVLRANGLALVESAGVYRIVAMDDAAKGAAGTPALRGQTGFALRVLPLRFVAAGELKSVIEPFLPPGGAIQADPARNLVIVSGPSSDLDGIEDLVRQFDVDWIGGTSFGLYPLRVGRAKDVANDLEEVMGGGAKGALAGLVRIVPIERLNAILVIASQRSYLQRARTWIDRLDYGDDETTPRLFEYRVQNSRAADLAAVLTKLFASGSVSTVQAETAPGSRVAKLVSQQSTGAGGTSGMGGTASGAGVGTGGTGSTPSAGGGGGGGFASLGQPGISQDNRTAESGPPDRGTLDEALQTMGGNTGGPDALELPQVRVVADEKNNALVIYARPRDYRMIESIVQRLDIVPLQVLIDATIAEVTLNDALSYGLQFYLKKGNMAVELSNATSGSGNSSDITNVFPGFNYVFGTGSSRAVLSALSAVSTVHVISSPQLLVLDHQTAALQVGDQVPIITQAQQGTLVSGAPIINSIDYRATGVLLRVTPRVNSSGVVTLDIDQDVSDVATTTTSTIDSPTFTERRIVSSVMVQDGHTVALGGLILDNRNTGKNGIPLLSDIPVVGSLFGTTTKSLARTELLVLLTPRIIRDAKDARDMTEELRQRLHDVKPLEIKGR